MFTLLESRCLVWTNCRGDTGAVLLIQCFIDNTPVIKCNLGRKKDRISFTIPCSPLRWIGLMALQLGADLGGSCRGCLPPSPLRLHEAFLKNWFPAKNKGKYVVYWRWSKTWSTLPMKSPGSVPGKWANLCLTLSGLGSTITMYVTQLHHISSYGRREFNTWDAHCPVEYRSSKNLDKHWFTRVKYQEKQGLFSFSW